MISIRETTALKLVSNTVLRLGPNPGRRAVFGILGVVLLAAFVVGFDPTIDLVRQRIPWLALYIALTLSMFGAALYAKIAEFNAEKKTMTLRRVLGPIDLEAARTHAWTSIEAFELQRLQVLRANQVDPKERRGGWMAERSRMFRLYVFIDGKRVLLDDSTHDKVLSDTGAALSQFTGKPYRETDI